MSLSLNSFQNGDIFYYAGYIFVKVDIHTHMYFNALCLQKQRPDCPLAFRKGKLTYLDEKTVRGIRVDSYHPFYEEDE